MKVLRDLTHGTRFYFGFGVAVKRNSFKVEPLNFPSSFGFSSQVLQATEFIEQLIHFAVVEFHNAPAQQGHHLFGHLPGHVGIAVPVATHPAAHLQQGGVEGQLRGADALQTPVQAAVVLRHGVPHGLLGKGLGRCEITLEFDGFMRCIIFSWDRLMMLWIQSYQIMEVGKTSVKKEKNTHLFVKKTNKT